MVENRAKYRNHLINRHRCCNHRSTSRSYASLIRKDGGYISNDITPPGTFLDNMPNWEYGALIQSRDLARALREVLSRSQSQSQEDVDLTLAEPRINFQNSSWALPATESEYRDARRYLQAYLDRLPQTGEDSAQFYAEQITSASGWVWLKSVWAAYPAPISQRGSATDQYRPSR